MRGCAGAALAPHLHAAHSDARFRARRDHMRTRFATCLLLAGVMLGPADSARAQQTLNFTLGYFTPHGEDARGDRDVLNENRTFLTFDIDDFNGPSIGAEWLV